MEQAKGRIWELDALRGLCILCVIAVHFIFDLSFFAGAELTLPAWYTFIQEYGGAIFVILSGCCATLGRRSFRRGAIVFGCGMLISLVTFGMYRLGMASRDVIVQFGVLHLLGVCMMLYPLLKKLPTGVVLPLALCLIAAGYLVRGVRVQTPWLFPLGLITDTFFSSDYFPLLPQLGYFLLGIWLGRTVYREKKTRLPGTFSESPIARFFCLCGRHSLLIYLVHQPVLYGVTELGMRIIKAQ